MKTSNLLGLTSTFIRNGKWKIMVVGAQLAYLSYRYIQSRRKTKK